MVESRKDVWASGDAYEPYVGRWSRMVARSFVDWLAVPAEQKWLDVGCGTGALCEVILERGSPSQVTGIDPSEGFVAYARHKVTDDRAAFEVGEAQSLPIADAACDVAVAALVLNFLSDQKRAIDEMRRTTRRRGTVAAYVSDYPGAMQMMRRVL